MYYRINAQGSGSKSYSNQRVTKRYVMAMICLFIVY